MNVRKKKEEFIKICKRVYDRGLSSATGGNVSERIGANQILIKPTGYCLGDLTVDDLVMIDLDGNFLEYAGERKPSTELPMHAMIYRTLPEAKGVIHSHSPFGCGFAVANLPVNPRYEPLIIVGNITIPCLPYREPHTEELGESVITALTSSPTYMDMFEKWGVAGFLLGNHGSVSIGKSLMAAYYFTELIEESAKVDFISRVLRFISEKKP